MSMTDLLQSLEMGQKSCRLVVRKNGEQGELYFASGQCRDAKIGKIEGDDAVYKVILWGEGEFEIDFKRRQRIDAHHHHEKYYRLAHGSDAVDGRIQPRRCRDAVILFMRVAVLTIMIPYLEISVRIFPAPRSSPFAVACNGKL